MRVALHRLLLALAMVPLLLAFAAVGVFVLFAVAADRALPNARWGNCWTYAAARWARLGGYVALRPSDGIAVANAIPIPHAIWLPRVVGEVRMTYPLERKSAMWFPAHLLLFGYEVWHGDGPHAADWTPSDPPEAWRDTDRTEW